MGGSIHRKLSSGSHIFNFSDLLEEEGGLWEVCLEDCRRRWKKLNFPPALDPEWVLAPSRGGKILNVLLTGGMEREQEPGEAEVTRDPRILA